MTEQTKVQQDALQPQCPNCGANLTYDPTTGKLLCDHCNSTVGVEQDFFVEERSFEELRHLPTWKSNSICTYRCQNCGAVTTVDKATLATTCPFCNSPVVMEENLPSILQPNVVVPFELSQKDASAVLAKWRKGKLYAPRNFRKSTKEQNVKGVFVPCWTFDAVTSSPYSGKVGQRRTRTVRRNGKTYTQTYIHWYHVSGVMDMSFDDMMIQGNNHVPQNYFNQMGPFPQNKYVVYDQKFLAGFVAEHYSLQPLDAYGKAVTTMKTTIKNAIMRRHNADVEGSLQVNFKVLDKSFKYLMLPVYVANTKYRNKLYSQYVSGIFTNKEKMQAKVCGKSPVSPWKVLLTVVGIAVAVFAGLWLFNDGVFDGQLNLLEQIAKGILR